MTEAPEKMWFTKVGKNIIPNSQRMSPEDVEYLRKDKHIAYLADYRAAYEESCQQIDSYKAEIDRLNAEASVMEAWLSGVASKPPETGRKKLSVQAHGEAE